MKGALVGGALVGIVIVGVYWLFSPDTSPEAQRRRESSSAAGIITVLCENAVKEQLRAPGTADFPFGHGSRVQTLEGNRYALNSYVDAENGFGGEVRTNFICVVEGSGEDPSGYRVTDFALDEN